MSVTIHPKGPDTLTCSKQPAAPDCQPLCMGRQICLHPHVRGQRSTCLCFLSLGEASQTLMQCLQRKLRIDSSRAFVPIGTPSVRPCSISVIRRSAQPQEAKQTVVVCVFLPLLEQICSRPRHCCCRCTPQVRNQKRAYLDCCPLWTPPFGTLASARVRLAHHNSRVGVMQPWINPRLILTF